MPLTEPREQRQLSNIERLTKQTIELASVPTLADLRDQQVASTVESLVAALERDDDGGEIPATFPNGYSAFYCMKRVMKGVEYAGFLNTLLYGSIQNMDHGLSTAYIAPGNVCDGTWQFPGLCKWKF